VNIVDENIPMEERALLKKWRIRFRFIGQEIAHFGVKDPDILRVLHHLKQPTLFTRDDDFFARDLCHDSYCLLWLNVEREESAHYIRAFLRHPRFQTKGARMGIVARAHPDAIHFWKSKSGEMQQVQWLGPVIAH
jgi:hypothetical protein